MWEGETPQGTCCACAIVGWKTDQMFKYGTSKNLHDKKKGSRSPFVVWNACTLNSLNDHYKDLKLFRKVFVKQL